MRRRLLPCLLVAAAAARCSKPAPTRFYDTVVASRRDLVVSVSAAGLVEPILTVEVKSKASGEIIEMRAQTGDDVQAGQLLARIDPRLPKNTLAQAEANLDVARAQLQNAQAELRRAQELFTDKMIAETEHDAAQLAEARAKAQVVTAEADLQNARDQMQDTEIRAPVRGTILQKNAELGTVISSPTRDVAGGTVLLTMADLDTIQVRALVDETDIGKIATGPEATVRVQAYPNRSFHGRVVKIEPQATVQQNVTMFPVLIQIGNPEHLLRPGMNTEVELSVGERHDVVTIPNAALRTQRDVASAAQVVGMTEEEVQAQLAARSNAANGAAGDSALKREGEPLAAHTGVPDQPAHDPQSGGARTMMLPNGREVALPAGVDPEQVRAIMRKRFSGEEISDKERTLLRAVFGQMRGGGGRGPGGGRTDVFTNRYIVFQLKAGKPAAAEVQTGLTDLDQIEVTSGLAEGDTVLVLPSASLLRQQQEFRDRFNRVSGGGLPGVQQQQRGASPGPRG